LGPINARPRFVYESYTFPGRNIGNASVDALGTSASPSSSHWPAEDAPTSRTDSFTIRPKTSSVSWAAATFLETS